MTSTKSTVAAIKEGIRRDLGLQDSKVVEEAYVAVPKHYDLNTELLSAKNKGQHVDIYENHVESLNRISAELDGAPREIIDVNHSVYRSLKADEVSNLNSVYLHELFFANISDVNSQINMDTLTYMRLQRDFGTFDAWQWDFIACAMSGSGWAVCGFSTFLQKYVNFFVDGDSCHVPVGFYPIIVLDLHEHSYSRDYLADKKSYIFAMMKELDWDVIEERFKRADKIGGALR